MIKISNEITKLKRKLGKTSAGVKKNLFDNSDTSDFSEFSINVVRRNNPFEGIDPFADSNNDRYSLDSLKDLPRPR